jgi:lipopolysaccharide/colanic/teichoic acid biosynthesis glycosyltransferase
LSSQDGSEEKATAHHIEAVVQHVTETPPVSAVASPGMPRTEPKTERAYLLLKRCLDVVLAGCLLILILPLLAVIAIAVFIDNPGPILFSQMRVGRDNRLFRFYKFRSMVKNAPALQAQLKTENEAAGPIFKMRRDPRVTRVGRILRKYSLDELPQLYNVLRGDMSLVGPRPHLPSEVAQYEAHQRLRLTVQPGLVCLREIYGRSELTFERWIELDLQYIASRSLWTDLGILLRLVPAVLCGRGAY